MKFSYNRTAATSEHYCTADRILFASAAATARRRDWEEGRVWHPRRLIVLWCPRGRQDAQALHFNRPRFQVGRNSFRNIHDLTPNVFPPKESKSWNFPPLFLYTWPSARRSPARGAAVIRMRGLVISSEKKQYGVTTIDCYGLFIPFSSLYFIAGNSFCLDSYIWVKWLWENVLRVARADGRGRNFRGRTTLKIFYPNLLYPSRRNCLYILDDW